MIKAWVAPPLVSVIIPAYNAAPFIEETLASVLAQTHENLEVLVVDDGSRDNTAEIISAVAARDPRVRLLHQANKGVAAARNLAIANSRGEFIAPIDADDLWAPQKIERQLERMARGGAAIGLVYTWSVDIDEKGLVSYPLPLVDHQIEGDVLEVLIYSNFTGNASTPLIRRACLAKVGGYDCSLRARGGQGCEDWDLALRLAEHCRFAVVPSFLVGYRRLAGGMSQNLGAMHQSYELMMERVQKEHPELPESIFRWSRGDFYGFYLSSISHRNGDHAGALRWIYRAIRLDPTLILALGIARSLASNLFRLATGPVMLWLGNGQQVRLKKGGESDLRRRLEIPFSELEADEARRRMIEWRQWSPHQQLRRQRVRRLTGTR